MIGYSKCGDIMIIVEFYFDENAYKIKYIKDKSQPYIVDGIIKDMYKITEPTKKYFKLGSQGNKYIINREKERITVFTSLDKLKEHYQIPDEINLHVSAYCKTYYNKNQTQLHEEYYHNNYIKEGLYKSYYKNGQLEKESTYVNGEKNGLSTLYVESGSIYLQDYYKNDVIIKRIYPYPL